jgi:hypothetical protein
MSFVEFMTAILMAGRLNQSLTGGSYVQTIGVCARVE